MSNNSKIKVAAKLLGCDVDDVEQERYDSYGLPVFSNGSEEYAIGTDDECDEAVKQYIQDSVWSFRPEFIASHTRAGATSGMIKAIKALQEACESCNDDVKSLIEDFDGFVDDAVSADGRGRFLSSYDGDEQEVEFAGETYYAYRIN